MSHVRAHTRNGRPVRAHTRTGRPGGAGGALRTAGMIGVASLAGTLWAVTRLSLAACVLVALAVGLAATGVGLYVRHRARGRRRTGKILSARRRRDLARYRRAQRRLHRPGGTWTARTNAARIVSDYRAGRRRA